MDLFKLPFFDLVDEAGEVFRSEEMLGLKWVLAYLPGNRTEELQVLESRHAKAMMMNAPIIVISDLVLHDLQTLRNGLGSRMKMLSDPKAEVFNTFETSGEGASLAVIDREHRVVSSYDGVDVQTLDRALRKASRI